LNTNFLTYQPEEGDFNQGIEPYCEFINYP
jgi:hypothetical protein